MCAKRDSADRRRAVQSTAMNESSPAIASAREGLIEALGELVAALDRRLPDLTRSRECEIVREAARLRMDAIARIEELLCNRTAGERRARDSAGHAARHES